MNFFKRVRILLWVVPALLVTGFSLCLLLFPDSTVTSATLGQLGSGVDLASTQVPTERLDLNLQATLQVKVPVIPSPSQVLAVSDDLVEITPTSEALVVALPSAISLSTVVEPKLLAKEAIVVEPTVPVLELAATEEPELSRRCQSPFPCKH